jgi:phosphohistidine phosphatase SixA
VPLTANSFWRRGPSVILALVALASARNANAQRLPASGHGATVVIVIRHAEKDSVPKEDPPLTEKGRARARALVQALASAHVDDIIVTQLRRSRETAAPLAEAMKIVPEVVARTLPIEGHARAVARAVHRHDGHTVLVVGHGETVGAIMVALGAPRRAHLCASDYSELFILVLEGSTTRLIRGSYGAPSLTPADCSHLR